ncbi:MAG: proton-conducting transporter membrane subunit [Clostridium sp.]|nr:proton-conducting transporter membrane subunit [Clostridium sp.]
MLIPVLIGLPVAVAAAVFLLPGSRLRELTIYTGAFAEMILTLLFLFQWIQNGSVPQLYYTNPEWMNHAVTIADIALTGFILYLSVRYLQWLPALLSLLQTGLVLYTEHTAVIAEAPHMMVDRLALVMCVIIAFVGGFICIYAVGYMKGYHHHNPKVADRRYFFFSMLFLFLGAMYGLVLSQNLIWMYFFWEITSVISFLLIGYTRTEEAIRNSFKALWMNLFGGLGFAVAIALLAFTGGNLQLSYAAEHGSALVLACLSLAALTKSAQLPFSNWLFGAMVAPTPSSALLHSATMVKAGVYLLIRLSPAFHGSLVGFMVSMIGGFTFIVTSMMAISQNDAKKVLAFSTISNLGLIVACAGIGAKETVWGAIFLMIFHAVSKSMLFQSVGSTENSLFSRDIEDMHGMLLRLPKLTYIMGIGIAGMYLAPFGMLISKWVALKAFVDSGNVLLVLFIAYGSATTMFYWTKWLSKLISQHRTRQEVTDVTHRDEYLSMYVHAASMVGLCLLFPALAFRLVNPIVLELFGDAKTVLSMSVMTTMVIMLASIVFVPLSMFLVSRAAHSKLVPIYMNGINIGDNTHFVGSFGQEEHLYLSNWYLRFEFGRRRLLRPSIYFAASILVIVFCLIIGGIS